MSSHIIEHTDKAVLFKTAGPERVEMAAKTAGNRKRIAAAFETSEGKLYEEYFKRLTNPQPLIEVPSAEAPVHEIAITGKAVDRTEECRLPEAQSAQPLRSRHQYHRPVRSQAHLHG